MSVESSIALLRVHDSAQQLSDVSFEDRERVRAQILATPVMHARRRARRRLVVALAAGVAALLFAAAGWAVYESVFHSSAQVRDDFQAWAERIELPPGAQWHEPNLDGQGLYGGRAAEMIALGQATCAWFSYWDDAHNARATGRMRDAAAGFVQVRAAMPLHPNGANEEAGGYAPQALSYYDRVIEQQGRGVSQLTEQYLRANCR